MDAPPQTHPPLTTDVVQTGRLARREQTLAPRIVRTVVSTLQALGTVIGHAFHRRDTIQYPEEMVYLPPRYRGRIILSRDPDGDERCVACYLCAVACPVDCIALQATEDETGRRYPACFRINFSRCIFCGFCEEACPTYAIQLTPDVRDERVRAPEHGLREGGPADRRTGQVPRLRLLPGRRAGRSAARTRARRQREAPPVDVQDLLPMTMTALLHRRGRRVVATVLVDHAPQRSSTRCCTWSCRCSRWPWSSSPWARRSWPPSR